MSAPDPGFTPAPDCVRDDIDRLAALVFGAVWRWCQMEGGECFASVEAIAERAGVKTTATRARLRILTERGWLTADERPSRTTVYRDAGRWQLRAVGVDMGATRNVGQRETLGNPTRDVGPLKREPKRQDQEGIFLTEDSGTHEPQASATEPLTLVVPSAKPSGAFTSAVRTALVDILAGGEESLALNGRTGRDAAWVGRCLGMLGRWTTTDADAAIAWLGWWRRSEQWRFRGASPHRWPAAMAAARDAYNDRPAANGQRGPIDLNRRVDFDRPLGGSAGRSRGPIDLDRR